MLFLFCIASFSGQRIKILLTGQIGEEINPLQAWLKSEPLVDHLSVPSRDLWGREGGDSAMKRFIRLYFPRTYESLREFDFLLLNSPVLYFFANNHIQWMYDTIREGSGGLNTASVMSGHADIHTHWASSILQEAFPNDAPAVVQKYQGGNSPLSFFKIVVNRKFPEPVLTPFLQLGVESYQGHDSRIIIPREGSGTMAWQVGNNPKLSDVPFLLGWEFGNGRSITTGDAFGHTFWSSYRGGMETDNIYALDMLMNLIFWATDREVQENILLYHSMRTDFLQFRERMGLLGSLTDFVEKFGANSRQIQVMISEMETTVRDARLAYLEQDFEEVEAMMEEAFEGFERAEMRALELKDQALLWVYMIEWFTILGVSIITGIAIHTLMIRRKLYKNVEVTRAI
jgi:hypothetical protein